MTREPLKRVSAADNPALQWQEMGGDHIWLPYTQMKTVLTPLLAVETKGSMIRLQDGRELIDGVASWWTACHGYNHPYILEKMGEQLSRMPHIMFGGINHAPALRLAQRLARITPGDLARVFFSDSGSIAVEVALKMSAQYWKNKSRSKKTKFLSFRHGYHGDTMACMSLSDPDEWVHANFHGCLPEQLIADLPQDEKSSAALAKFLERHNENIAAAIVEPLVQGVGGMRFHDKETLQRLAGLCKEFNVLLIADEIFTGFGRTGEMFATQAAGIVPDILCLGKALTGGALTLAATLARPHIFDAFWSDDPKLALMHGPTYMANPLACAAANASLDLFEREPRLDQVRQIETWLTQSLFACKGLKSVRDVRVKGAVGVVELKEMTDPKALKQAFIDEGVWIRVMENVVYLTPAFTITKGELSRLTDAIFKTLKD